MTYKQLYHTENHNSLKFTIEIIQTGKYDTTNTHIHRRSLSRFGTITSGGVTLVI